MYQAHHQYRLRYCKCTLGNFRLLMWSMGSSSNTPRFRESWANCWAYVSSLSHFRTFSIYFGPQHGPKFYFLSLGFRSWMKPKTCNRRFRFWLPSSRLFGVKSSHFLAASRFSLTYGHKVPECGTVVIQSGEGMLGNSFSFTFLNSEALWGALKSTVQKGDKVLAIATGVFGYGVAEMAKQIGNHSSFYKRWLGQVLL